MYIYNGILVYFISIFTLIFWTSHINLRISLYVTVMTLLSCDGTSCSVKLKRILCLYTRTPHECIEVLSLDVFFFFSYTNVKLFSLMEKEIVRTNPFTSMSLKRWKMLFNIQYLTHYIIIKKTLRTENQKEINQKPTYLSAVGSCHSTNSFNHFQLSH